MELYEKIKARRLELNLTLEDVGNIVGVGKSTVRKWETGNIADMKRDKIALLSKALKVSPLFIMGISEETPQPSISKNEKALLDNYNQLNDLGKKEAIKRVSELAEIPKYNNTLEVHLKEDASYLEPIAAHNDNINSEELDLIKEDIEMIKKKFK